MIEKQRESSNPLGSLDVSELGLRPNVVSREEFVAAVSRIADQVWDFHNRWGLGSGRFAGQDPRATIGTRQPMLYEEMNELDFSVDDREAALEAADVVFVALGHVEALGDLGIQGIDGVVRKNERKTEATHAIRPDTGKLLPKAGKPHKWE